MNRAVSGIPLAVLAALLLSTTGFAQDATETASARGPGFRAGALNPGRTVVMVTGESAVNARILEDAIAVQLLRRGHDVVSRPLVERAVSKEVTRLSAAARSGGQGGKAAEPESQLDAAAVGQLVNAQTVLVCVIAEEARTSQLEDPTSQGKERRTEVVGSARIVAGSLQAIKAGTGELMGVVALRCPKGADSVQLAAMLIDRLLEP